jgi:hypothetical protein
VNIDFTQHHLVWDNVEEITISLIRAAGTTEVTISYAKRGDSIRPDIDLQGVGVANSTVSWDISDGELNPGNQGRTIHRDDLISATSGAELFRVISADLKVDNSKWSIVAAPER